MRVYSFLERLRWPRGYAGKFLAIAFVGVHIPLLTLLTFAAIQTDGAAVPYLIAALVSTLVGTALVFWISYGLLAPVLRTARALKAYDVSGEIPDLPVHHSDEAGQLMAAAQALVVRLDRLSVFRRRLLGVLSHDLRTPLSSMLLATGMLQESARDKTLDPDMVAQLGDVIEASVAQMDALLTTIVSASRIDAPELPFEPVDMTTGEVLAHVTGRLKLVADGKKVALERDDHAPAEIYTDALQLEQVLTNLLTNAIKFTPSGGTVRVTSEASSGGVSFVVTDTGIGMSPEQVEAAFSPTGAEQRHGTNGETGTGLGLWIVLTFVRNLGGHLSLSSEEGVGTTFRVFIPATRTGDSPALAGIDFGALEAASS